MFFVPAPRKPGMHSHLYDPGTSEQVAKLESQSLLPVPQKSSVTQPLPEESGTYPGPHSHLYDPGVLMQTDVDGHIDGFSLHSLISDHRTIGPQYAGKVQKYCPGHGRRPEYVQSNGHLIPVRAYIKPQLVRAWPEMQPSLAEGISNSVLEHPLSCGTCIPVHARSV